MKVKIIHLKTQENQFEFKIHSDGEDWVMNIGYWSRRENLKKYAQSFQVNKWLLSICVSRDTLPLSLFLILSLISLGR